MRTCLSCGITISLIQRWSYCPSCKAINKTSKDIECIKAYNKYRAKADASHKSFDLSIPYIYSMINRQCFYCDDIGYISMNMIACCPTCNFMKNKLSHSDFVFQCKKIHNNICLQPVEKRY